IHPVLPPDVEFAVIDDEGNVFFHSDADRNRVENLFAETEPAQLLRSVVYARNQATLDLRYWGTDVRAHVEPVHGPPLTVVALHHRGALEMANVQALLVALAFILLYAALFGLALVALALLRPGYRPEWLWPAPERSNDYVRLLVLYSLLCLVFA